MKCTIICVFIVTFSLNCCTAKKLPSFIKRCKLSDPVPEVSKCITENAVELIPRLKDGIPEMKLPAIEPLQISKLDLSTGDGTSNGISLIFDDLKAYGLKDIQVKEVVFDIEKLYMSMHVHVPNLNAQSVYNINGKLLLFELRSTGPGQLNISDVEIKIRHTNMSIVTRKEKRYLNIGDSEIEFVNYNGVKAYFGNLFQDNKELTEQTNKVINENIEEVAKDLKPALYEALRLLLLGILKPVFDGYSLEELFE